MKKIDIHLHLTLEQQPRTASMYFSSAEAMIPHLEELGIEHGILMSSGQETQTKSILASNTECEHICSRFPEKFHWLCNINETEEQVYETLLACKKKGAVGIGELMINQRMDSPLLQTVFASAQDLEMPILFHMSPQVGYQYGIVDEAGLPLLEENLKRYPNLKFIGHSQPFWHEISGKVSPELSERMKWGSGAVTAGGRVPYLLETYENLYGDLSANSGGCAVMRDEAFGLTFLEKYQDRLMFGTDMVNNEMQFPLGGWLDEQERKGALSKAAYEKICRKNAEQIFKL